MPFTAGYRGFALGLGTLAAYGLLVVAVTGAARGRLAVVGLAARAWRVVHVSAYAAWLLAMAHGVLAGTDTGRWWAWSLYAGCAPSVSVAGSVRAWSARRPPRLAAAGRAPAVSSREASDDRARDPPDAPTAYGVARLLAGVTCGQAGRPDAGTGGPR